MRWTITLAAVAAAIATGSIERASAQEPVRTIEIHAKRFSFSPSEVTLKKGETVDLRLISEDVTHALSIKDLKINREVSKGHPVDVVITPQSAGEFHGQCGRFCGSGHGSMTFTLHVTD